MNLRNTTMLCASAFLLAACAENSGDSGGTTAPPVVDTFELGDPIDGLTPDELAAFHRGKIVFERRFKPSEGLGPFYNATSCASCHSTPITGGSAQLYRNFYIAMWGTPGFQMGLWQLPSPVVPAYGSGIHSSADFDLEGGRIVIPETSFGQPVVAAQRNSIPIFGVGLFEFISNEQMRLRRDPNDEDNDGISGRVNADLSSGSLGRFGVKAQANNIESFTRAPLQNQMGITTDPFEGLGGVVSLGATQAVASPNDPTIDADSVPDPEMSTSDLGDLIAFTRFLAPPRKKPFNESARRGEDLFAQVRCTACHVPKLASSRGPVHAYTDLLLHDLGPDLADGLSFGSPEVSTISPATTDQEFRTQPLWGVSMHAPYLHDGRAETLYEAITMHKGEATGVLSAFDALSDQEKRDIIAFLEHL